MSVSQPTPPSFTPSRIMPAAKTWAEVQSGLNAIHPGYRLPCEGVAFPAETVFAHKLSNYAEVTFDSRCKFPGGQGLRLPAIWFKDVSYLRFVANGCVVTNSLGPGISFSASDHCVFDGWNVTSCACDATNAFPTKGNIQNSYFRLRVSNWSLTPSLDPHAEKGTGFHGMNFSDASTPYHCRGNTIVLTTDGSKMGGSLLEYGQPSTNSSYAPTNNKVWLKASNLLQDAKTQTAANALNLWGSIASVNVVWIEATNLHGYAVSADPGSFTSVKVQAGAAANCCLNPRYVGHSPWQKTGGVQYSPGPFAPTP